MAQYKVPVKIKISADANIIVEATDEEDAFDKVNQMEDSELEEYLGNGELELDIDVYGIECLDEDEEEYDE
jgi:hypothetical protein